MLRLTVSEDLLVMSFTFPMGKLKRLRFGGLAPPTTGAVWTLGGRGERERRGEQQG